MTQTAFNKSLCDHLRAVAASLDAADRTRTVDAFAADLSAFRRAAWGLKALVAQARPPVSENLAEFIAELDRSLAGRNVDDENLIRLRQWIEALEEYGSAIAASGRPETPGRPSGR